MKYVTEYRDAHLVKGVIQEIKKIISKPWVIMEICGGQTHSIVRYGIDQLLPPEIELVHGPGCPVCVTPLEQIDRALAIAAMPDVIFTSYGDMLRVPGSEKDLFSIRAAGGDVRVVYSPLDAVKIAQENSNKKVVFFAIGFETTAPANVMAVMHAKSLGLNNFSILVSHVRVPPAIQTILGSQQNRVQGFLLAGHVCTVMGYHEYPDLAKKYDVPMSITGFEPLDLVNGILNIIRSLENGHNQEITNSYSRAVTFQGNIPAQEMINKVFMSCDRAWRGIGIIPQSGWCLRPEFNEYNAEMIFEVQNIRSRESEICIAGSIMQGLKKPLNCPAFGGDCTPEHPLGATMVSSEGSCAAYYKYGRNK
ncbi:MAG: hydrogenase formation protein HypD [Chloroflexota bacterium]